MRNIDWLYQTNSMFRETVNQGAAQWMGSDSPVFAGEWLLREHEIEQSDLNSRSFDAEFEMAQRIQSLELECAKLQEELRKANHYDGMTTERVREIIERHFGKVAVLNDGKHVEWRDDWVCKIAIDYKGIAEELRKAVER